jgi:hypothetical protein
VKIWLPRDIGLGLLFLIDLTMAVFAFFVNPAKTRRPYNQGYGSKSLPISLNLPHKCWKRHRTEKRRVRAGVSIKGQAKGLTFYADRPRTSISLSIAQREYVDKFY